MSSCQQLARHVPVLPVYHIDHSVFPYLYCLLIFPSCNRFYFAYYHKSNFCIAMRHTKFLLFLINVLFFLLFFIFSSNTLTLSLVTGGLRNFHFPNRKLYRMLTMPVPQRSSSIWIAVYYKHSHLHYYQLCVQKQIRRCYHNSSLDLHSFPITMLLSRKKTGRAYRVFSRAAKPRIHTKLESLELDSILCITLLVRRIFERKTACIHVVPFYLEL